MKATPFPGKLLESFSNYLTYSGYPCYFIVEHDLQDKRQSDASGNDPAGGKFDPPPIVC